MSEQTKAIAIDVCPKCGGQVQATVERSSYYNLVCLPSGRFVWDEVESVTKEMRFYCENDHEITDSGQFPEFP